MNELTTIFNHKEFGKVRALNINGEPWFAGADVATCLGYVKPSNTIREQVKSKHKKLLSHKEISSNLSGSPNEKEWGNINSQGMYFINEAGMYSLIMKSTLPKAEEFQDWVTEEVLPSIRKTGGYSTTNMTRMEFIEYHQNMVNELRKAEEERLALEQKHNHLVEDVKENMYMRYAKPPKEKLYSFTEVADILNVRIKDLKEVMIDLELGREIKSKNIKFEPYVKFFKEPSKYFRKINFGKRFEGDKHYVGSQIKITENGLMYLKSVYEDYFIF